LNQRLIDYHVVFQAFAVNF